MTSTILPIERHACQLYSLQISLFETLHFLISAYFRTEYLNKAKQHDFIASLSLLT